MKKAGKILLIGAAVVSFYWLLIAFPDLFFKSRQLENLTIYYHGNKDVGFVSEKAFAKIKSSSLYNPNSTYRVFLTDSALEYSFYTSYWRDSGGVFIAFANGNIFIRPSLIEQDRLISPSGKIVAEDRPLNYYVAHEVTHAMQCEKLGFSRYFALDVWIREGIADKVGRDKFDFDAMLEKYKNNAPEMNPAESGLYLKYQLLVEYAFKYKQFDADKLLEANPDESQIEIDLRGLTEPE